MRIIGITGGIGTGKSTVASILASLGASIVDADKIARLITKQGKNAYNEIIDKFSHEILNQDMELDRRKLANLVFNDKNKLALLNTIMHKYISDEITDSIKNFNEDDTVVIDCAIPLDKGFMDTVTEIWVISSDREIRIQRVMERNNLNFEEVSARINSQMKDRDYLSIADHVIYNNGTFYDLEDQIKKLF